MPNIHYRGFGKYGDEFVTRFSIDRDIYEYFLNFDDTNKVQWLARKSEAKALNYAKERADKVLKNNVDITPKVEPQVKPPITEKPSDKQKPPQQLNLFSNKSSVEDPKISEEEFEKVRKIVLKEIVEANSILSFDETLKIYNSWKYALDYSGFLKAYVRAVTRPLTLISIKSNEKKKKTLNLKNYSVVGKPIVGTGVYTIQIVPHLKQVFTTKQASYPEHPDEIVINNFSRPITEIDVYNYYEGIKDSIIPELKGRDLFIRQNHDKKTEFIRINNVEEFDEYHSGKIVEYYRTSLKNTDEIIFDFNPNSDYSLKDCKAAVEACLKFIFHYDEIFTGEYEIRFTGSRSFHLHIWLKKKNDITDIKKEIEDLLKEYFKDDDRFIIANFKVPKGKININLSPMDDGYIVPYSMRIETGFCCVPINRRDFDDFKPEDARFDDVYHKLTKQKFVWGSLKKSGYLQFLSKLNNILTEPSKHELPELFRELQFGRPKADQDYLDKKIEELKDGRH